MSRNRPSARPCRYEVRHVSGVGQRSPPRGGVDPQGANQQLLVDDDNDDDLPASAAAGHACSCPTISAVAQCSTMQYYNHRQGCLTFFPGVTVSADVA